MNRKDGENVKISNEYFRKPFPMYRRISGCGCGVFLENKAVEKMAFFLGSQ